MFFINATNHTAAHNKVICLYIVYPKKYAHGFCFAVLCCGYTLTDFPISIRLTSLALWQSNDCPSASKAILMNMDKYFMWIHYERLHNHKKSKAQQNRAHISWDILYNPSEIWSHIHLVKQWAMGGSSRDKITSIHVNMELTSNPSWACLLQWQLFLKACPNLAPSYGFVNDEFNNAVSTRDTKTKGTLNERSKGMLK